MIRIDQHARRPSRAAAAVLSDRAHGVRSTDHVRVRSAMGATVNKLFNTALGLLVALVACSVAVIFISGAVILLRFAIS